MGGGGVVQGRGGGVGRGGTLGGWLEGAGGGEVVALDVDS